jgi:hypothetical protein
VAQEFHISVTPLGNEDFLVRTERVAPGVPLAEEQIRWSVEAWLTQTRQLLNDPLLALLQDPDPLMAAGSASPLTGLSNPSLNLMRLGQLLYSSLFQGSLRDSWVTAQGIAHNRGEMLRLRLGLRGLRLPCLPWEVLCEADPVMERLRHTTEWQRMLRPLTTGMNVVFSRYLTGMRIPTMGIPPQIQPGQPLRILMAIASPSDRDRLNLRREAQLLQEELRIGREATIRAGGSLPEIQLTILEQPGREQLTQALEQGHYQVFHYAGHSTLGASGGNLYLVNRATGLSEILRGDDLAGLLVNNHVYMAVFNSCQGSFTVAPVPNVEGGWTLAEALIRRGVPAVLAMAERIPDHVALNLTRLFYRNLKQRYPIDLSLNRARQGLISSYGSRQFYWALPVLYMHPDFDGYLLQPERSPTTAGDRLFPPSLMTEPVIDADWEETLSDLFIPQPVSEAKRELDIIADAVMGVEDDLDDTADSLNYADPLEVADELTDDLGTAAIADMVQQLSSRPAQFVEPSIPTTEPIQAPAEQLIPAPDQESAPEIEIEPSVAELFTTEPSATEPSTTEPSAIELSATASSTTEPSVVEQPDDRLPPLLPGLFRLGMEPTSNPSESLPPQLPLEPPSLPDLAGSNVSSMTPSLTSSLTPMGTGSQIVSTSTEEIEPIRPILPLPDESDRETEPATSEHGLERWLLLPLVGAGVAAIALSVALIPKLKIWQEPTPEDVADSSPVVSPSIESRPRFSPSPNITQTPTPEPTPEFTPTEPLTPTPTRDTTHTEMVRDRPTTSEVSTGSNAVYRPLPSPPIDSSAANSSRSSRNHDIKSFLDNNNLAQAEQSLNALSESNDPMIQFLRGRLAWQAVGQGYANYNLDNAREAWQKAVEQDPDSTLYRNALAFAYYEEGKAHPDTAETYWTRAMETLDAAGDTCVSNPTRCAIQALIWMKRASYHSEQERATNWNKAIALREQVLAVNEDAFQPDELARDWLWIFALDDWRSLLRQEPIEPLAMEQAMEMSATLPTETESIQENGQREAQERANVGIQGYGDIKTREQEDIKTRKLRSLEMQSLRDVDRIRSSN